MKYQCAPEDEHSMGPLSEHTLNIYLVCTVMAASRTVCAINDLISMSALNQTCIYTPDRP